MLALGGGTSAGAQSTDGDLFVKVGELAKADGTEALGRVSLSGNIATVGEDVPGSSGDLVHVFERQHDGETWFHSATLTASDETSGFGRSTATDGRTIAIGADGAVYLYRRGRRQAWREIAKLTGEPNASGFGFSVGVSGRTVVIGARIAVPPVSGITEQGVAYVFEQNRGRPRVWTEVALLKAPAETNDVLGGDVAIDGDVVVVGAQSEAQKPTLPPGFSVDVGAYVFSRDHGGPNAWGRVATLPFVESVFPPLVSISGDTVAVGSFVFGSSRTVRIFERNTGGPNAWGAIRSISAGQALRVALSGDFLVVGRRAFAVDPFGANIFARNQGGKNAWGEVLRIPALVGGFEAFDVRAAAVSGDTAFLGAGLVCPRDCLTTPIEIFVADTDRDGLRDSVDPCPRDPLNNVSGNCQRASTQHPVLDDLIVQDDVSAETQGRRHIITATFTNTSATAVRNPFFEVTELGGNNVLLNGDAGRGGVGATLSPDVGDGILSPGEPMTVTFQIRLRTQDPFSFRVAFHGDPIP
jgi:hypothetical protein